MGNKLNRAKEPVKNNNISTYNDVKFKTDATFSSFHNADSLPNSRTTYASVKTEDRNWNVSPKNVGTVNTFDMANTSRDRKPFNEKQNGDLGVIPLPYYRLQNLARPPQHLVVIYPLPSTPKKIENNPAILSRLLNTLNDRSFSNYNQNIDVFELEILAVDSGEFKNVNRLFLRNTNLLRTYAIEKVYNLHLLVQYNLKKREYIAKNIPFTEMTLFHGTKEMNVDSILEKNYDWRLTGSNKGYRFGRGVNFSPFSFFASNYCDDTNENVMIANRVIVAKSCVGTSSMVIPPINIDTSTNSKKSVYVKYDDNTFYPSYLISYEKLKKSKRKKKSNNDNVIDESSNIDYISDSESDSISDSLTNSVSDSDSYLDDETNSLSEYSDSLTGSDDSDDGDFYQ